VIGQILPRGTSVRGLLYYLFTEGRAGEKGLESDHRNPRVIASWDDRPQALQPPVCAGKRDFTGIVSRLTEPLALLGFSAAELRQVKPVHHLTIAAAKDPSTGALTDRLLTDGQWADIAAEYMHRLGLAPRDDPAGVRWVAVRHADDHIHVVATLARQDGRRPGTSHERHRSREASRFVERKYGLRATSATTGLSQPPISRAEMRKHAATVQRSQAAGRPAPHAPDRQLLRRHVRVAAAGASSLPEFLDRLRTDGLLVRERHSTVNHGEITGYAVALPHKHEQTGAPIFFGGGKLAPDLTVPRLLLRWQQPSERAGPGRPSGSTRLSDDPAQKGAGGHRRVPLTRAERDTIWTQAIDAASTAADHVQACAATNPAAAADTAWAASDFLAAAGRLVDGRRGGPLTAAAEQYDLAARDLLASLSAPTGPGSSMRTAARRLLSMHAARPSETAQLLRLMSQLSALVEAVTRLRETQQRATQVAAAQRAADLLATLPGRYGRTTHAPGRSVARPPAQAGARTRADTTGQPGRPAAGRRGAS
jgi:hypothetical protein